MKHLLPYFKKYKIESIIAPLFKMLESCFDLVVPIIVAAIIDKGIATGDKTYIITRFLLLIAMAVCGFCCTIVAQFFAAKAATGTATGLRRELMAKISTFSFAELDKTGASTLVTRMTSDVNQVQEGINRFLRLFLRSPFIVFGAMIMAFTINAQVAIIFVIAIPVLFAIVFGIMRLTSPMYKTVQKNLDSVTNEVREDLNGVRVIRAFGREEVQRERFVEADKRLYKSQIRVGKVAAWMNPLTYLVINAGIIAILWLSSGKVNDGVLLSGGVIALINYISQILVELVKLANVVIVMGKAGSCLNRIGEVLDAESSIKYAEKETEEKTDDCSVRFENVSLTYAGAGAESLTDINVDIKRGSTVGIIGGTGSGKSSLVNLIPRFYDATKGSVFVNGKNVKDMTREELLSSVAIVDQKPLLFSGTIRSNMQWGKNNATDEEIWRALELAQAAEFVRKKDGGLDEKVSRGGANFSGGQKQRLSIARALMTNAPIIIFDDSSSALDYATDAALRHALKTLPKDTTVITVSQRTSSIAHADKIIVLDDGKIAGAGTHDELLSTCEVYKEIYDSQTKGNEEGECDE